MAPECARRAVGKVTVNARAIRRFEAPGVERQRNFFAACIHLIRIPIYRPVGQLQTQAVELLSADAPGLLCSISIVECQQQFGAVKGEQGDRNAGGEIFLDIVLHLLANIDLPGDCDEVKNTQGIVTDVAGVLLFSGKIRGEAKVVVSGLKQGHAAFILPNAEILLGNTELPAQWFVWAGIR